jgi:hypothetical protein
MVTLRIADVLMARYTVESKETDSYEDYDANLFVICQDCYRDALAARDFVFAGDRMVPEMGCLGPMGQTSTLGLSAVMDLVLRHEQERHLL